MTPLPRGAEIREYFPGAGYPRTRPFTVCNTPLPRNNGTATAVVAVRLGSTKWVAALLTPQHFQESLSRAYVHAIAGRTGLGCSVREFDYGIDLTLHQIVVRTDRTTGRKRHFESGAALDIQVKSTTNASVSDSAVRSDLDVNAYDDLRDMATSTPRILVLHVQPKAEHERVNLTDEGLLVRGCCYWTSLRGHPAVPNRSTVRICIPRINVLSEHSLREIMKRIGMGEML